MNHADIPRKPRWSIYGYHKDLNVNELLLHPVSADSLESICTDGGVVVLESHAYLGIIDDLCS